MSIPPKLHISEEFARFFEAPSRERLRDLLRRQSGEYDFLDFKEAWPEGSELARHILAFANSGSGCVVIGVSERDDKTLESKGMPVLRDKTAIKDSVRKFLPETVAYEIHDFEYTDSEYQQIKGKKFQVLMVALNPDVIPVLGLADGAGMTRSRIYVRRDNSSTEADHAEVQALIRKRIERSMQTPKSRELQEHLAQLEMLYERRLPPLALFTTLEVLNPKAGYYRFIDGLIQKKQKVIERLLDS